MVIAKTLIEHAPDARYHFKCYGYKSFDSLPPTNLEDGCSHYSHCIDEETDAQTASGKGRAEMGTRAAQLRVCVLKLPFVTFLSRGM